MRSDIGVFVAAALAWAAFFYKLRHLRQRAAEPGAIALRALVVLLGLMAFMFLLLPQAIAEPLDTLVGLSGAVRLIANMLAMVTSLAVMAWLLYLSNPEEEARARLKVHSRVLAVMLLAVVVIFAFDHPPVTPDREFAGAHMHLFILYLGYVEFKLVVLSWRYASMVQAPLLRLGQRTVAVAIVFGLVFLLIELIYLIESDLGTDFYGSPAMSRSFYLTAAALLVIGLTVPAWGPRIGFETAWWRVTRWHAARRMRPLWTIVTGSCPSVVLDRTLLAASPHGKRLMAERLPVEILDGWLLLRSYLTDSDVADVARLAQERGADSAAVAAAYVLIAVRRRSAGAEASGMPPVEHLGAETGRTLVDDARFLCAVAKALRSPFIRAALAQVPATAGAANGA